MFRDGVDHYHLDKLLDIQKSRYIPDQTDIEYIKNNINLDEEEKRIVGTVFQINHKDITYDQYNRPDHESHIQQTIQQEEKKSGADSQIQLAQPNQSENTEKRHFQNQVGSLNLEPAEKIPQKSSDSVVAQRVSNIVAEAFSNM